MFFDGPLGSVVHWMPIFSQAKSCFLLWLLYPSPSSFAFALTTMILSRVFSLLQVCHGTFCLKSKDLLLDVFITLSQPGIILGLKHENMLWYLIILLSFWVMVRLRRVAIRKRWLDYWCYIELNWDDPLCPRNNHSIKLWLLYQPTTTSILTLQLIPCLCIMRERENKRVLVNKQ